MVFGKEKHGIEELIHWNPVDLDPSEQQLPAELIAFEQNFDRDVVKNLYGQEVIDYCNNVRNYRRRAKSQKINWAYDADKHIEENRWYKDNKDKVTR